MTTPAIRVEHLGKRYQIGHNRARHEYDSSGASHRYKTLRDALTDLAHLTAVKKPDADQYAALVEELL